MVDEEGEVVGGDLGADAASTNTLSGMASSPSIACRRCIPVAGLSDKYIAPTVLTGVTHEMRIMNEEVFGPALPIIKYSDVEDAIAQANVPAPIAFNAGKYSAPWRTSPLTLIQLSMKTACICATTGPWTR